MWWTMLSACFLLGSTEEAQPDERPPTAAPKPDPREDTPLRRVRIDAKAHPQAVCNDGSVPVFYHRPGSGDGADKWVIWFKGGGSCSSEQECDGRDPGQRSAKPWMRKDREEMNNGDDHGSDEGAQTSGILDSRRSVNPDFHDWNHAYLVYCTSDNWAGTRAASDETWGLHFQGSRVTDAMLDAMSDEDLVGDHVLADASIVLLTGSSAGSIGLRTNVDRLAASLAPARVLSISDAGVAPKPTAADTELNKKLYRQKAKVWRPKVDESCAAGERDDALCLWSIRMLEGGYIDTPMFMHQDQFDPKGLKRYDPKTDRDLVAKIADEVRRLLDAQDAVFVPAARDHTILTSGRFSTTEIEGVTMAEAVGSWVFDREGATHLIQEPPPGAPGAAPRKGNPPGGKPSGGRKGRGR